MKIDIKHKDLYFVWDTDSHLVTIYEPLKMIGKIELPPISDYRQVKAKIIDYMDSVRFPTSNNRLNSSNYRGNYVSHRV